MTITNNVDPQEIKKFAELSTEWWKKDGAFKTLHEINPLRLKFILDLCPHLRDKKVIDVGCGGGLLTEKIAEQGAITTGIDMGHEAIEAAKFHAQQNQLTINYHQISAENFACQNSDQFDVVTCFELLEHVPNPSSLVKACVQLAKPNGTIFFSTINRNPKAYVYAILGAEYCLQLLPKGTHDYAKFLKPSELAAMVRNNGATTQKFSGISYNILQKSYSLTSDISVNYIAAAVRTDHFLN